MAIQESGKGLGQAEIAGRAVGEGLPCFIIAEMGLGHDGSLGAALAFIDTVAAAGADAVKFQTHIAEAEGTAEEAFRVNVFPQDATRGDYWRRTAFTEPQWHQLKQHADDAGIVFLSSAFSSEAVRLLQRVGVPAWKVASGETNNPPLLREMAATGLPVLLSTGMSTMEEVDAAVAVVQGAGAPLVVFQCTNRYPCPPEHMGLNMIEAYRERYGVPIGYSCHSGRAAAGLAAQLLGACAVEVHVAFHRQCFGPDVPASVTVEEFAGLVRDIRFLETALSAPVSKNTEAEELSDLRTLFTKSIVAASDLAAGTTLSLGDMAFKKPGTGIPAAEADAVAGRKLRRAVSRDEQLKRDDLDE
ncbi:MAG: N-acetylneuraminate synthase family protein [Kiritimatiellia bacterium]|jgi:N-acetylneuraminate synthase|nr:N-acetylneuraminate synthase family protein [Kiritimatiellia bacterium]MDP7024904.1 N-acetylneuraminate synthase family protein [Kiritimatiellia bacterium]